ncbi:MAG: D-alanine--D-alanine ligase [Desulfovibrionaceae bacterium]|nr:D-alanine--D-alanine ligase [Desulfovibrionaceae bacterium]MBF0513472.1 D-alanine--D-alanine ligase [Desulfovibrionaceae bacterium]
MRILLIAGGWSSEREVSLAGAGQIAKALTKLGHEVEPFDPACRFDELTSRALESDFCFINLHGSPGEDGLIQALLDAARVPYQGSGPAGSFLALHKAAAKQIFARRDLPTPEWEFLPKPPKPGWTPRFDPPWFVKPNLGGSSLGMSLVQTPDDLFNALTLVFQSGETALIERVCAGPEVTCGVLGDAALPLVLIQTPESHAFFDYEAKYSDHGAREICPAPIDEQTTAHVQSLSRRAHDALGLSGYSRADFILTENGPMLLEVNTLPGMTAASLIPKEAAAIGMSFEELIAELIKLGLARQGQGE